MRVRHISSQSAVFGIIVAIGACMFAAPAMASQRHSGAAHASAHGHYAGHGTSVARYYRGGGLQCVPFARENTGIELAGNASAWWSAAEGVYERGARPEVGSVLNFRANGRMRMGHVAVVSNVADSRNIEIDHANWAGPGASRGGVSRNITVVDVSPANDWSAVRVALGHTGEFGSVYPTYGFIYDRPDHGTMVANNSTAPAPVLNAPPRDLRPVAERIDMASAQDSEEVAEASDDMQPRVRRVSARHGGSVRGMTVANHGGHGSSRQSAAITRVQAHTAVAATSHAHHIGAKRRT